METWHAQRATIGRGTVVSASDGARDEAWQYRVALEGLAEMLLESFSKLVV